MQINIIIPTFNRKELLNNLLVQIKEQASKITMVTYKTIVVVDGSNDGTIEMLREIHPAVYVVLHPGDLWYTKSMNLGFEKAQQIGCDYVLTLNDDIVLDNNYLAKMAEIAVSSNTSIVGSLSLTMHQPPKIMFSGIRKYIKWRQKNVRYHRSFIEFDSNLTGIHPTIVLPGRGMLIPADIVQSLNGFDEFFIQYHSDEDFCLRAAKIGVPVNISWDARLYSYVEKTAAATNYMRVSVDKFIKSFFNPYSRSYIPQKAVFYYRHGIKLLWPITMLTFFLSNTKAWIFNKKII